MSAFYEFGITDIGSDGRTTCPQCSADRKKHSDRCLSVDVDEGIWFCFHCEWKGSLKGKTGFKPIDLTAARRKKKNKHAEARVRAYRQWEASKPANPSHPYLVRKCIEPNGVRQIGSRLLIPVFDREEMVSLQYIYNDGQKRFLVGGQVKGCCFDLRGNNDTLVICEGFATACTIHQETWYTVFAALSAGNIPVVAEKVRKRNRCAGMIIAADHDDAGIKYGQKAAKAVDAALVFPPTPGHDFNDYAQEGDSWPT